MRGPFNFYLLLYSSQNTVLPTVIPEKKGTSISQIISYSL